MAFVENRKKFRNFSENHLEMTIGFFYVRRRIVFEKNNIPLI